MPRNRSRPSRSCPLDRTLVLAVAMLFIIAQLTILAVRAQASGPAGLGEIAKASRCDRSGGAHLELLLLKHRPHLLLGGPIVRP